jgi:hypothetical protein
MSAGANRWVILLWGIAPAGAVLLFALAFKVWALGHPCWALLLVVMGLIVAVLRWIWR